MLATIKNSYHWEDQRGTVVGENETHVTVRILDKYNDKLSYDVKFPRAQVVFEKEVAQA
jgi:hypothetical protein